MVCVGIDVAKDKHDCFILSSEGAVLADVFTIENSREGFDTLLQKVQSCTRPTDKIKVGLEATGHYVDRTLTVGRDDLGAPVQKPPTAHKLPSSVIARSAATRLRSRS